MKETKLVVPHASTDRIDDAIDASIAVNRLWPHLTAAEQVVAAHLTEETAEETAHNLGVTAQAVGGILVSLRRKYKLWG